ncbi:amidohydrolase [Novosphingobium bradum]|uniref:Amidohydrolase n=1 Tax=Novosphingobium bradum TaxID=1737444 RepID=A0ABV7IJJ7_9SPHN
MKGAVNAVLALLAIAAAGQAQAAPAPVADIIFQHGTIIPMTAPDARAEAVAVKDGRVLALGSEAAMARLRGKATRVVDLAGQTLLPGFIDAHGHLTALARMAAMVPLASPPVGPVTDIAGLQAALRERLKAQPGDGWIVGNGYDDSLLAEHRHPTRAELDAVSADRPIFIMHVSGHLATLNTRALDLAGMLHPAADPPGGVIHREADGRTASGPIEETAIFMAMRLLAPPSLDQQLAQLDEAQRVYARNGLTTAQDGATMPDAWDLLAEAARRSRLILDVDAVPLLAAKWPALDSLPFTAAYAGHLRAAGIKLIIDGSPQGRTAWLSEPYHQPPPGQDARYAGYRQVPDEVLRASLRRAANHGWQVYAHVNGDAAIQQLIDAVRAVNADGGTPLVRPVAVHAQTARHDQLVAMKALGIVPSFFAAHTFYWGDWHREVVLGAERAERISPQREAIDLGLAPTIHNDAPIVPPDMIRLVWSAATRRTRSGDILGAAERVSVFEALGEVTRNAALQLGEDGIKGTIEPGKYADFVVLSANPLATAPEDLLRLKVSATYKQGRAIYSAAN